MQILELREKVTLLENLLEGAVQLKRSEAHALLAALTGEGRPDARQQELLCGVVARIAKIAGVNTEHSLSPSKVSGP